MGAAVGLMLGLGLVAILAALTPADPPSRRPERRGRSSRSLADRAGLGRFGRLDLVVAGLGLSVAAGLLAQVLLGQAAVSAGVGVLVAALCHGWLLRRANQRERRLAAAWPEVLDLVSSSLRAGLSFGECLVSLESRAPLPLRADLDRMARDVRATGRPAEVLRAWSAQIDDPTGQRATAALVEVAGSPLGSDLLRESAARLREDARLAQAVAAQRRGPGLVAQAAFVVPPALLLWVAARGAGWAAFDGGEAGSLLVGSVVVAAVGHRAVSAWATAPLDEGGR